MEQGSPDASTPSFSHFHLPISSKKIQSPLSGRDGTRRQTRLAAAVSIIMSPTTAAPLAPSSSANVVVGHVRATPPGHMLGGGRVVSNDANDGNVTTTQQQQQIIIDTWHSVRSAPNKHIDFVKEGFDHVLGKDDVRIVDGTPVGGRIVELDDDTPHHHHRQQLRINHHRQSSRLQRKIQDAGGMKSVTSSSIDKGGYPKEYCNSSSSAEPRLEPEEEDALRAELASRRIALSRMEETGLVDDIDEVTHRIRQQRIIPPDTDTAINAATTSNADTTTTNNTDGHEYGASRTPLDAPIGSLRDKWRILPHFLKLRGLMKQHIDSFDHFVTHEMKQIVQSASACEIRSEYDPKFYLRYTDCWVGEPSIDEDSYATVQTTPFQCRLRDCTYSAPIYVNVRYTRGRQIVVKKKVVIGRMPIMLRSSKCLLYNKSERELARMKECPYDPGGYFIVKGVEKVILIQEQLSKNRVIIEEDPKTKCVSASITSSTRERKSKAYIFMKHGRLFIKHNTLADDVPICIAMKAMGVESDMEFVQSVGSEPEVMDALALSLEEPTKLHIATQRQALQYIGNKMRAKSALTWGKSPFGSGSNTRKLSPEDEARDVLANVVLSHVPVEDFDFRIKVIYIGHIVRRLIMVHLGKSSLDDKDYYGNKRLELAGSLLSLLFEDLFKHFNTDLKRQTDMVLSKPNRAQAYDVIKAIRPDSITYGMMSAISSGNWVLKRFRMDRAGVTQVLSRLSYMSALGMMTRVNSQFEKTRKVSGPRSLQASQWGMLVCNTSFDSFVPLFVDCFFLSLNCFCYYTRQFHTVSG